MVPIFALVFVEPPEITFEQAVTAGTRILAAFDVPEPYRMVDSGETKDDGPPGWLVDVTSANGLRYDFRVDKATGQVGFLERSGWYSDPRYHDRGGTYAKPSGGVMEASLQLDRTRFALTRCKGADTTMPGEIVRRGAIDEIEAPAAVDGHPFIDALPQRINQPFRYKIVLDASDGALLSFVGRDPDGVERAVPTLTEPQAAVLAQSLLRTKAPERATEWYIERKVDIDLAHFRRRDLPDFVQHDFVRRLGWYGASGQARLGWRIPYEWRWRTAQRTDEYRLGGIGSVVIDAATGKPLSPVLGQELIVLEAYEPGTL